MESKPKKNFFEKIIDFIFSLPFLKKKEKKREKTNTDDIYPLW
tara:strand:+ start:275 stop:403 length:129 start_codon:yes stop_codon:yes gene_type:complete